MGAISTYSASTLIWPLWLLLPVEGSTPFERNPLPDAIDPFDVFERVRVPGSDVDCLGVRFGPSRSYLAGCNLRSSAANGTPMLCNDFVERDAPVDDWIRDRTRDSIVFLAACGDDIWGVSDVYTILYMDLDDITSPQGFFHVISLVPFAHTSTACTSKQ